MMTAPRRRRLGMMTERLGPLALGRARNQLQVTGEFYWLQEVFFINGKLTCAMSRGGAASDPYPPGFSRKLQNCDTGRYIINQ